MANIIIELNDEIGRVRNLIKTLDDPSRRRAGDDAIRFAKGQMAMGAIEGMREALEDLREIKA